MDKDSSQTGWQLFSAGDNSYGQLGRSNNNKIPGVVQGLSQYNIKEISTGHFHCAALCEDGTVLGWGKNIGGRLGFSKDIQEIKTPTKINGLPHIISVKCGTTFTLFLSDDHQAYIASKNNQHSLIEPIMLKEKAYRLFGHWDPWIIGGNGNTYWVNEQTKETKIFYTAMMFPKQIISLYSSAFLLSRDNHLYALSMENLRPSVKGSLTITKNTHDFTLLMPNFLSSIDKIAGINDHLLILKKDKKVIVWRADRYTHLGIGESKDNHDNFVDVTACGNAKICDIAAGDGFSILIDNEGHLWGFGDGKDGQTLQGRSNGTYSDLISDVTAVYCGCYYTLIETNASLSCKTTSPKQPIIQQPKKAYSNSKLHQENRTLQEKLSLKEKENFDLQSRLDQALKNVTSLERINESKDKEISLLHQQIDELKQNLTANDSYKPHKKEYLSSKMMSQEEIDEFKRGKSIGKGSSSEVIQVSREEQYALKILSLQTAEGDDENDYDYEYDSDDLRKSQTGSESILTMEQCRRFLSEYEIMCQISHPNIVKTFGICYGDEENPPSILLEFCPTNLGKCIKKLRSAELKRIIHEICTGMAHIHKCGIIHRDLKPENILLDSKKQVKIADFGISTLSSITTHTQNIGTIPYMSPEQLNNDEHYTNKVDVYSFGKLLYFILTRGSIPQTSILDIVSGKGFPIPSKISDFFREMIEACTSFNPNERPSFKELQRQLTSSQYSLFSEEKA